MTTPSSTPNALPSGVTLCSGAYEVHRVLGQGGFGITYLGTDVRLKCQVAIKEFFPVGCVRVGNQVEPAGWWTHKTYADGCGRFLHEGQVLARFSQPGVVRVLAAFEENATIYIVMEYLHGPNLHQYVQSKGGKLPLAEAVGIVTQAGSGLQVLHDAGLLHRDIKPSNMIRTEDGRIVLIDFGSAKEYMMDATNTESVHLTPGYAALEQYTLQVARAPYTDVYSLAAVLYSLVLGGPPPPATDRALGIPISEDALASVAPAHVVRAIVAALSVATSQRPQTVDAFLRALEEPPPRTEVAPQDPSPSALPEYILSGLKPIRDPGRLPRSNWPLRIVLLLLVLGIGAGLWRYPEMGRRMLDSIAGRSFVLDSEPAGALVLVNGRETGKTPLTLRGLSGDTVQVSVVRDGYLPWKRVLRIPEVVRAGKVTARLEPARAVSPGK